MPDDNLSRTHFRTVRAEIEGRFFSKEEADQLKDAIDHHTITDPQARTLAAKAWETIQSDNTTSTFKARSFEHMAEVLAESQRQAEALKKAEEIKNKEA